MPTQMEQLANSATVDAAVGATSKQQQNAPLAKGIRAVSAPPNTGSTDPLVTDSRSTANKNASIPVNQKETNAKLMDQIATQEHVFGYNDNNRAVAERVARDEDRLNSKSKQQLATPLTPGEASKRDIEAADLFENLKPESVVDNTMADEHISQTQRREIWANRADQVTALRDKAPDKPATSRPAPPAVTSGMEGQPDAPPAVPSKPAPVVPPPAPPVPPVPPVTAS